MADRYPLDNTFERASNGIENSDDEGQNQSSPVAENRPRIVNQQRQWHRDQQRRAQAEEARTMGRMQGGVVHQNDDLGGFHAPNSGFQLGADQYHGQIANVLPTGVENSDPLGNARRSAREERTRYDMGYNAASPPSFPEPASRSEEAQINAQRGRAIALRNANAMGYNANLAPSFPGVAQGGSAHAQRILTPVPRNPQVAPIAPMLARVPPQIQIEVPPLQITDPRWIIDRERQITVQNPRWLADWVHAEQTAMAQDQLRTNTNRMLEEEIATNGGRVPTYLVPFLPPAIETEPPSTNVPMPTTFPPMTRVHDLNTPEGLNSYLVEFSTRWPGQYGTNLEPAPEGITLSRGQAGWSTYIPTTGEVATWRAFLVGGTQRTDGGMWIRTTLAYVAATALTRLELYGGTVDPDCGPYDTREAFEYALGRVLQACPDNAEIQRLGLRVQRLLRNAPRLGPPAFPMLGQQLLNEHIRRVRGDLSGAFPAVGLGGSRPAVPSFSASGNRTFGPAAVRNPSPFLGSRPSSAMGNYQGFNSVATASMLPPGPGGRIGTPGPAAARGSSEFLGGRPTPSPALTVGPTMGQLALNPLSAPTASTIDDGMSSNAGIGSTQPQVPRRRGRPRGSTFRNKKDAGRGSTTASSTTTPAIPVGSARRGHGGIPRGPSYEQANASSMRDARSTSISEEPGTAGTRPNCRRSLVNYGTTASQQQISDDDDGDNDEEHEVRSRCRVCGEMETHAPNCPKYVARCEECGYPAPNHQRDCPES
ncbi:hypothetical protein E2P81_ATG08428 [Venturia nashicola]|uniref:Uncharacterized protein n=1 Tax=Venturia nashicola TaxID=86259 RepID=A0A4Z1NMS4_9PEZI|nr:hypothetical protein E6O75_ATG08617 [Venturia nashicola]TLD21840.1 hypothetical protein E2P81_ATG08428 [Venturia nashicola]